MTASRVCAPTRAADPASASRHRTTSATRAANKRLSYSHNFMPPPLIPGTISCRLTVKAAIGDFYATLSARDIGKMEALWAPDGDAILINPRDKSISVGKDAVKKNWETVFGSWSELKVTWTAGPIRVSGSAAWAMGTADVTGKVKDGTAVSFEALNADVLQKRGDK